MSKYLDKASEWHGEQMYGDKPYRYHLEMVVRTTEAIFGKSDVLACVAAMQDAIEGDAILLGSLHHWLLHQPEFDLYEVDFKIIPAVIAITKIKNEARETYLSRVKENRLARQVKIAGAMSNLRQNILDKNLKRAAYYQNTLDKLLEV